MIDDHEILRRIVTEWVSAVRPPISEFGLAEKALDRFRELLDGGKPVPKPPRPQPETPFKMR